MKHFINLSRLPPGRQSRAWSVVLHRLVRLIRRANHPEVERARIHVVVHADAHADDRWTALVRIKLDRDLLTVAVHDIARPEQALRRAFDEMERRVRAHLRARKGSRKARRARRSRAGSAPAETGGWPVDNPARALQGQIPALYRLARGALRALEEDAPLGGGSLGLDDLVDETLARAWERWSLRPFMVPVDQWLEGILTRVVEEEAERQRRFETVHEPDGAADGEEDADPRRDARRWLDRIEDPPGLAFWDDSGAGPNRATRIA